MATLSNGMNAPDGEWVDGGNVTEHAPGATSPTCTYSGAADPTDVKSDRNGNVFVVDWNIGHQGAIDVYK
ncbi:MAG TPA: hypothetical protein VGI19_14680 [Candidatus Cybelea sp.]